MKTTTQGQGNNYLKLRICETASNKPGSENRRLSKIIEVFETLDELKEFLTDRYEKMPLGKRKIYIDGSANTPVQVGFLHSFWNKDWSCKSKSWFQTDWITITSVTEIPLLIH